MNKRNTGWWRHALGAWLALCMVGPALAQTAGPPRTIADVLALLQRYQPEPQKVAQARTLLHAPAPTSDRPGDLYAHHNARAWAAQALGDNRTEIEAFEKAVQASTGLPREHLDALQSLSNAQMAGGNRSQGLALRAQALALASQEPGRQLTLSLGLILVYGETGELEAMREVRSRLDGYYTAARNQSRAAAWMDFYEGMYHWAVAYALQVERKATEAEVAFRRAMIALERDQDKARYRARSLGSNDPGLAAGVLEVSARNWDYTELYFAQFLIARDRLDEAELALRNLLGRQLKRIGRYNMNTATTLAVYATLLSAQGRFQEGQQLSRLAEETLVQAGVVPESGRMVHARRALATAQAAQAQWPQAVATYTALREGLAKDPATQARLVRGEFDWALSLVKTGAHDQALAVLAPELTVMSRLFGPDSSQMALLRGVKAMALAASARRPEALAEFQAALAVLLAPSNEERDDSPGRTLRVKRVLEGYIEFLYEARNDPALRHAGVDPTAESFRAADLARGQSTQRALAQSAARAAVDDPAIGALVRQEQDMAQEISSLYGFLLNQMNLPADQQLPQVQAQMRERIEKLSLARRQLRSEIAQRFPRYADLVTPHPATLEDARRALRPGEVLVSVLSTAQHSFVWAIRAEGPAGFHAAALGEAQVAQRVATLRKALDPGDVLEIPAFDIATAHALYAELLAPLEPVLASAQTLVASVSGALSQLPLSVLVTRPTTPTAGGKAFEAYRQVPWLARRMAVAYTPSVTAFARLRALPPSKAQRKPLLAFADPVFGGAGVAGALRAAPNRLGLRNAVGPRAHTADAPLAWHEYAELAPLPDTREEVLSIAAALGADAQRDVVLGAQATRQRVQQADLAQRRIVVFATHGLIPGDLSGLHQPALALSVTPGETGSPLLTLEDVLRLKLDADWVVLSACNTASGDGQGAEAISGLGRGFFYAGTRALLVTHWPVETVSARLLTTGVFQRYAGAAGLSRAQALQQAMLALLEHPGTPAMSYAHPLFWAPYALVGDAS